MDLIKFILNTLQYPEDYPRGGEITTLLWLAIFLTIGLLNQFLVVRPNYLPGYYLIWIGLVLLLWLLFTILNRHLYDKDVSIRVKNIGRWLGLSSLVWSIFHAITIGGINIDQLKDTVAHFSEEARNVDEWTKARVPIGQIKWECRLLEVDSRNPTGAELGYLAPEEFLKITASGIKTNGQPNMISFDGTYRPATGRLGYLDRAGSEDKECQQHIGGLKLIELSRGRAQDLYIGPSWAGQLRGGIYSLAVIDSPDGYQDNQGSFEVKVCYDFYPNQRGLSTVSPDQSKSPTLSPNPLVSSCHQETNCWQLRVPVNRQWVDTGIELDDEYLIIDAEGKVNLGDGLATPDGGGGGGRHAAPGYPLVGGPAGALIARIGHQQPTFLIGSIYRAKKKRTGRVYLGVNDEPGFYGAGVNDNSGSWFVTLRKSKIIP